MKWYYFVMCTVLCWGTYVSTLHHGQKELGKDSALRAFLFVGTAYFLVTAAVLVYLIASKEPMKFTSKGVTLSLIAGVLGAGGALGIIFALKSQSPLIVAPLVFAGTPIMNTFVSMMWDKQGAWAGKDKALFFVGILMAAAGTGIVLRHKPKPAAHAKPAVADVSSSPVESNS